MESLKIKMNTPTKHIKIQAEFIVSDSVDAELLLETMEAAMKDILFDMPKDIQEANWCGFVESVDIKLEEK